MIPKKPNIKERETKTVNKTKRSHIIVPLVVMLMLICVIATIYIVGAGFGRKAEIAELNKDIEKQEEKISADIASTSIGTNVGATFTTSTGEIRIYKGTSTSTPTIKKSSWNAFLKKITAENNTLLEPVKIITFDNEVYAPEDSSNLFNPILDQVAVSFSQLVTINNLNNLKTDNVTSMRSMFKNCSALTSIDVSRWQVGRVQDIDEMFEGCKGLKSVDTSSWWLQNARSASKMFRGCTSLESFEGFREASFIYGSLMFSRVQVVEKCGVH